MKTIYSIAVTLLIVSFISCTRPAETITDKYKKELSTTADEFQNNLKSVLVKELQSNGVISALSVCSDTAQLLTKSIADSRQVEIKRISFKNRNSLNKPDSYEEKVLKKFESLFNAGKLPDSTIHIELLSEGRKQFVRFLKPIYVQPPCLVCHGDDNHVSPETAEKINSIYRDDKARNYKTGDLRGAISIKKFLSSIN
ncbi:MAG: DUF3365 domain-containing protein [Ignavibacteriales bacterium]|nr:MAG: DUF3365 domain-containing protein [Ignavibacteriales bacterium]